MQSPAIATPVVPGLELAFQLRAAIGETRPGGRSPKGERLHIEITGGMVEGPMWSGTTAPESGQSDPPGAMVPVC